MDTFPAFLAAWGPVDFSFGSGQGVKCYHSEHLYGELWHRAFTVCPDTPTSRVRAVLRRQHRGLGRRHRRRGATPRRACAGLKRVQIEPHLSITGAASAEWVPIRPKTDAGVPVRPDPRPAARSRAERLDLPFLEARTGSPYLVGPNGYYLRDPATRKPLVWDLGQQRAVPVRRRRRRCRARGALHAWTRSRSARTARPGATRSVTAATGVHRARRAHGAVHARVGRAGLRHPRPARSAASRPSTSRTRASARRSRSTASSSRCARSRSRSARP